MIRFGARISYAIVEQGEVWRLFSAAFVHYNFDHLKGNLVLLGFFIFVCEMVMGKYATLLIYLGAAAGGSLFASVFADYWSIGASGSVLGFIGAITSIFIVNRVGMRPETCFVLALPVVVMSWL